MANRVTIDADYFAELYAKAKSYDGIAGNKQHGKGVEPDYAKLCKARDNRDYGGKFVVIDMGDGKFRVSRGKLMAKYGRPLLRKDIYRNRMAEAESEYAHAFMCGVFPKDDDPERPSKEQWLNEEPYEFEVDVFVTEKIFGANAYLCG